MRPPWDQARVTLLDEPLGQSGELLNKAVSSLPLPRLVARVQRSRQDAAPSALAANGGLTDRYVLSSSFEGVTRKLPKGC